MKKNYIRPSMKIIVTRTLVLLSGSPGVKSPDFGLQYGGVDESGDLAPE